MNLRCCMPVFALLVACDNGAMPATAVCDAASIAVEVGIDEAVGISQTSTAYSVPLVVRASIPCLEGDAHAMVVTSEGLFTSTSEDTTIVTLTPAGGEEYVGFTTLQLSDAELAARVQVILGDASACEMVRASFSPDGGFEPMVDITDSGICD